MSVGLGSVLTDPVAFYDENAHRLDDRWNDRSLMSEGRARVMGRVRVPAKVLDVGCGTGRDAVLFAEAGYTVHAVDLSSRMLEVARAKVRPSVRPRCWFDRADMLNLSMFCSNTFDVVWMAASMTHLPASLAPLALEEAFRVIRPGGVLYNTVPAGSGTSVDSDGLMSTLWTEDEFRSVVEAAGFTVSAEWTPVTGDPGWLNIIAIG